MKTRWIVSAKWRKSDHYSPIGFIVPFHTEVQARSFANALSWCSEPVNIEVISSTTETVEHVDDRLDRLGAE